MNLAHINSLKAQTKNKTQKSFSNHLRYRLSQTCSCPTLKVLRWIEKWMMVYAIDSLNGTWSVRTYWCVTLPCCQNRGNARKLLIGVVILVMDQYVSWSLSSEEVMLDTIWEKYKDFCKPQPNEVRARLDLLTSFQQGNKLAAEWYNAVQTQVALTKYPPETVKILHRYIFWFFLKDEEFVSKTINDSNIDLDRFPASKVRQLAKKMESSNLTTRQSRWQVTPRQLKSIWCGINAQTSQQASTRKEKPFWNLDHPSQKNDTHDRQHSYKMSFDAKNVYKNKERCQKCGDSNYIKGFQCPVKNSNASLAINMKTLQASVTRRNKYLSSIGNQRPICFKQAQCMLVTSPYVATQKTVHPVMTHSVSKWRYRNHKLKVRRFQHPLTW